MILRRRVRLRRLLEAGALASLLIAATAEASRLPPRPELQRGAAARSRYRAVRVDWQKPLTERMLLEYEPRELGGPAIDPVSGDVVVANRRGSMLLLDAKGRQIWAIELGAAPTCSPSLTEDVIVVGTADGKLHAIDRFNGEHLWTQPMGAQVLSPPVVTLDAIFVGTDQDAVHGLDPISGETLWVYRRSTPDRLTIRGGTAVTVADGRVFGGYSDGALVALGVEDGRVIWQTSGAGSSLEKFPDSDAAPAVRDGVVYATVFNDGVYAYEAATGKVLWRVDAQGAHSLTLAEDLLLVGGASKALGLDPSTGATLWSKRLGKSWITRPMITKKVAFLAGPDGIFILSSETGRPLGHFFPGSGFSAPPAGKGADIYALSNLGFLYKLDLVAGSR